MYAHRSTYIRGGAWWAALRMLDGNPSTISVGGFLERSHGLKRLDRCACSQTRCAVDPCLAMLPSHPRAAIQRHRRVAPSDINPARSCTFNCHTDASGGGGNSSGAWAHRHWVCSICCHEYSVIDCTAFSDCTMLTKCTMVW